MLMALLYGQNEQIIAAAPACDQASVGDKYWFDMHAANIEPADVLETAYVEVADSVLCEELMMLGIDYAVDSYQLTERFNSTTQPISYSNKAA